MLSQLLQQYQPDFSPVVPFDPVNDRLVLLDFTETNTDLTAQVVEDTAIFSAYVSKQLEMAAARYGIGGYNEHRAVYSRSKVFDAPTGEEPRRLHLGIDIWGKAGTAVYAPMDGRVHSFAFNDRFGDYGATIILQHRLEDYLFHTLYGHLSVQDLDGLTEGKNIRAGELIAHFGEPAENGHWPPHLHFQLMVEMGENTGDYPGVCKFSERENYLANSPDPDLILDMLRFAFPAK
ncbi:MAG: peptidoglycan DD-metalloendopeptidase family protein [Bacteroidetes bacterium]|nr:peptidoglycan DD-metalloendopeptidase family protein [Bacteroidota bacterium]